MWIDIWALLNEKYDAHRIIKIHIFFFVTLDFLDWNFVKLSTTSLLYSPNFSCPNDDLSYTVV